MCSGYHLIAFLFSLLGDPCLQADLFKIIK